MTSAGVLNPDRPLALGLRANWRQFTLLVLINGFVGGMVGLERTVVPLIAEQEFGLVSRTVILSFILSFGVVKAFSNLVTGGLSDRLGRKPLLVAGWLAALPAPLIIMWAPSWGWIVLANVLIGISQGLCWSTTIIMKIDLVGPKRRGLAMGLNEFAGYVALSLVALATGYLAAAYGLRPQPFLIGVALALAGLVFSAWFVRETRPYARQEGRLQGASEGGRGRPARLVDVLLATGRDRALFSASQAGLVNNLNDGMVWGLLPLFLAGAGLRVAQIGMVAAVYPGVWGVCQIVTGALSDRLGRKWMIAVGLWVQAIGIVSVVLVDGFVFWFLAAALMGLGTALVYPTLLAAVGDVARPERRGATVGVYRFWRDGGYAIGALLAGALADTIGISGTILVIGALTALSGLIVAGVMAETLPDAQRLDAVAIPKAS